MHRQLSYLDGFVRENLRPQIFRGSRNAGQFETTITGARKSIKRICDYMLDKGANQPREAEIRIFVNHYARSVLTLFEVLHDFCRQSKLLLSGTAASRYQQLIGEVCSELDEFIFFIRSRFNEYFDKTLPIPFTACTAAKRRLRKDIKSLDPIFEVSGIDANTVNFALLPIRQFIKLNKSIGYSDLEYFYMIIEKLSGVINMQPDDPNYELHYVLFSINFNSPEYIKHCIRQLHRKYGNLSYTKQLEMYNWYMKSMKQVVPVEGVSLFRNYPPAIDQIKNYIGQEISYIKTLIKLENGIIDGLTIIESNKILTSFSVPVLAAIFKAFHEAGGFTYKSMAEAMRYFPVHFSTVGTIDIGEESFKSRVHNLEKAAASSGISFFLKCVNVLRKYQ